MDGVRISRTGLKFDVVLLNWSGRVIPSEPTFVAQRDVVRASDALTSPRHVGCSSVSVKGCQCLAGIGEFEGAAWAERIGDRELSEKNRAD